MQDAEEYHIICGQKFLHTRNILQNEPQAAESQKNVKCFEETVI